MTKLPTLKIKVIKKNTLLNYNLPVVVEKKLEQKTAERQIATNISGWIYELQQRQHRESKQFNQLFTIKN
jgi:negative regulator of sigma E activity